jgi:heat shock protein HtpX
MYRAIAKNKRNTVFIIVLFLVIIGLLGWLAGVVYDSPSITITVLVIATIYALIQYFAASRLAVSLAGGQEIQKADNPRLFRVVENLAITDGLPMPKVFIINDPAPNAFATGRDPQHAIVAATTGLLDLMDDQELEGVMAHEMGHVQNYDTRVSMIVFGLVVAIGFIADLFLRFAFFGGGRGNNRNGGGGGSNPIVLVFGLAAMIVAPLVAAGIQAAISRQREYLADATSAMTTRNPDGLASALEKLGQYGRPMRKQNSSMAHLWISDPSRPGFMSRLFSTHPPLPDRIERLHKIGGEF